MQAKNKKDIKDNIHKKKDKAGYIIKTVLNSLELLEAFKGEKPELGVSELSKILKLHKNKIFRLLATLEYMGYIEQDTFTENYRLGLKSLELGQSFIHHLRLLSIAKPVLKELVGKIKESAYVGVIREKNVIYLDIVEAEQVLKVASRVGNMLPIYATAIGKSQIAFESKDAIERLLPDKLKAFTKNTITDKENLFKELEKIRRQGYAIDNEELDEGIICVGAPLRDYTTHIIGGISVSAPVIRTTPEKLKNIIIPLTIEASNTISGKLGYEIGKKYSE
ncbi:MAG: IclR family transcriptional regulator [Candidatus Acidulodesulfobacterium ferriphilum]|uniref:IclR family transcriptional regulator n=1 Tax=Candidatus Acidulodesulfobacterium ferriphilum TaxID=2597223 RepID=A0A519BDE1_9DELT|nr:MAG: IclR family transcriptional regulator [Candidatus Acidulodesulfobacterium ferriphilum]